MTWGILPEVLRETTFSLESLDFKLSRLQLIGPKNYTWKPSATTIILARGHFVITEEIMTRGILREVLRETTFLLESLDLKLSSLQLIGPNN